MNKKGQTLKAALIIDFILAIVLIVVLMFIAAALLPLFANASDQIADTGYTATDLFSSTTGILVLVFVVIVLLIVLVSLFGLLSNKKK